MSMISWSAVCYLTCQHNILYRLQYKTHHFLSAGYQKQLTFKNETGGFATFPGAFANQWYVFIEQLKTNCIFCSILIKNTYILSKRKYRYVNENILMFRILH